MANFTYQGHVKVYDKKADGSALIIGKGDRKGEPYYKLSFKVDGEYVNLMDFEGVTGGSSGSYIVEYYQKFLPNGEPDLYNDKPQYQMVDLVPMGGAQATPAGAPAAPNQRDIDIRRAVALKAAVEEVSALVPAITATLDVASFDIVGRILGDATRLYAWLETGIDRGDAEELDQMLAKAKQVFNEPPLGFDDKPDPDGSEEYGF
jgi:hypothetical protein